MADSVQRPGYWDIVLQYLREGHRAWTERDVASASAVERRLGLSGFEGLRFIKHLESLRLIEKERGLDASGPFNLMPEGLAFMEGLPSIEQILAAQAQAIAKASGPTEPEKSKAIATLRDTTIRLATEKGIGWVLSNLPKLVALARTQFPWLPSLGLLEEPDL